ncbi:MAG TPA: tetratricopeptide repeat protein [Vineibacter sp.]|nr:tetratricopeptide repeat protein [Vineibacter sp.]
MNYDDYVTAARTGGELFEKGDYAKALGIFEDLAASDISPIDKARMLNNVAVVLDKMGRTQDAVRAHDRAIALEWTYSRCESVERKAIFLADKGDAAGAVALYESLLTKSYATEDEKHRFRARIADLQPR